MIDHIVVKSKGASLANKTLSSPERELSPAEQYYNSLGYQHGLIGTSVGGIPRKCLLVYLAAIERGKAVTTEKDVERVAIRHKNKFIFSFV